MIATNDASKVFVKELVVIVFVFVFVFPVVDFVVSNLKPPVNSPSL